MFPSIYAAWWVIRVCLFLISILWESRSVSRAFFYAHLVFERFIALFSCYPHLDQIQDIFNSFHRVGLLHELANSDQFHQRDIIPICIS